MRDNLVEQIISDVMNKQTDISPEAKQQQISLVAVLRNLSALRWATLSA
ncbi:propanediol utilization protein [Escherichia coli]|nr:propanediol utilization protein [Escherichia coli]